MGAPNHTEDKVMPRELWKARVTSDPAVHHGDPCIRGTRIPVAIILGSLADGMTPDEVIQEYPQLCREDVQAALEYAAEAMHHDILVPFAT
jgi:uncharacterized protein (DUF433 family)